MWTASQLRRRVFRDSASVLTSAMIRAARVITWTASAADRVRGKERSLLAILKAWTYTFDMESNLIMGETFERIVNVIKAAEAKGVTRYQISRRSGVNQSVLSKMVNGESTDITTETADRILEALNLEFSIRKRKSRER